MGLALLAAAAAAAAGVPPHYPASAFGTLPLFERPTLSPDGKRIAALGAIDGRQLVMIATLDGSAETKYAGGAKVQLQWLQWATNDRLLLSVGADDTVSGVSGAFRVTRLVSVDTSGGNFVKLNWRPEAQLGDVVINRGHAGGDKVLLSSRDTMYVDAEGFWPAVVRVDVATGKVETLVNGRDPIVNWYADALGVIRVGLGYNQSTNVGRMIYRRTPEDSFETIARAQYNKDQTLPRPVLFRAGTDMAVVYTDKSGRDALADYDLRTGSYGASLWANPRYDADGVVFAADGSTIAGVRYTDDQSRTDWLDPEFAKLQADLDKAVAPAFVEIVSLSADRERLLLQVSSPTSPGSYYLMNRSEGVMRRFAHINEQLKGAVLAPMTAVQFKARDGLDIAAYLTLPVGRAPIALPLIVMPHGGPWARDQLGYDYWVQLLANRGYAVLQPNFRGSTGYGNAFRDAGDGEWGLKMQDDITDGVRWLVAQGTVDAKRVCIAGGSYGGYAALQGAVRDPAQYRCAISFAGVSDLRAMSIYDRDFLYHKRRKRALDRAAPDLAAVSPVNAAATITTPVLLVHGKKDQVVPIAQSERMAKALTRAGKSVEFVVQPEGDHHLSRQADRIQLLELTEAFLKKHNPAD